MLNKDQNLSTDVSTLTNFPIPTRDYIWSVWDCFTLADYIRYNLDGSLLPDISWVYNKYKEATQPQNLVLEVVKQYCQETDQLLTGNLAILQINNVMNLGTIYNDKVIYMGTNQATWQPIERMATYLNSIWVYVRF